MKKVLIAGLLAAALIVGVALPAGALTINWTGTPGTVTWDKGRLGTDGYGLPIMYMGVNSATKDNFNVPTQTATTNNASNSTYWQYVQFHWHAYYLCGTQYCSAGNWTWTSGWFHTGQKVSDSSIIMGGAVNAGAYYTMVGTTTWYNQSGTVTGREWYWPTRTGYYKFDNQPNAGTPGYQWWGTFDLACNIYALQQNRCAYYGLYNSYNLGMSGFGPNKVALIHAM